MAATFYEKCKNYNLEFKRKSLLPYILQGLGLLGAGLIIQAYDKLKKNN